MTKAEESNGNGVKIPWPAVALVVAALIGVGISRADVGNLKDRVSKLESLPENVSKMSANIDAIQQQQTEMRQDIKALLQRPR